MILAYDAACRPLPYRPIAFGESDMIWTRATRSHEDYTRWRRESGAIVLYCGFHHMPGSTYIQRQAVERALIARYDPPCNRRPAFDIAAFLGAPCAVGGTLMSADDYLQGILVREAVDTGLVSPVRGVQAQIEPVIKEWANVFLAGVSPSGSFAKGTANHTGTDIDLFISLVQRTPESLKQIYDTLFNKMTEKGYAPKRQNVSISVKVNGYRVDLVPGKRQDVYTHDHSLYRRKADTWTKTNVSQHINHVTQGGRINESRIIKLWRDQKGLDFPSFYLELTVITALSGQLYGTLSGNMWKVLEYLRDTFPVARVVDPANSNNIISDDLTAGEKLRIKAAAAQALKATDWSQIVR